MSEKYEKLKTLLQELFQLDQPALKEAQNYVAQRQ